MTMTPQIPIESPEFPGDSTQQPPFHLKDSIKSALLWSIGVPNLAAWTALVVAVSKFSDTRRIDRAIKMMTRSVTALAGITVETENQEYAKAAGPCVFVVNHVNIFDMFVIYQSIPTYTRSLELAEHFKWPVFGSFITAAGQIPVDPKDRRVTAAGLKKAAAMLHAGDSIVVLPEGSRTLDGSVGRFYPGAFRLAINAGVPVVPMAIRGGRAVSRRGDWRIRPGKIRVIFGKPVPTSGLSTRDTNGLASICREKIIEMLRN